LNLILVINKLSGLKLQLFFADALNKSHIISGLVFTFNPILPPPWQRGFKGYCKNQTERTYKSTV